MHTAIAPVAPAAAAPSARAPVAAAAREPSATRFTARDYAYVKSEVRRILVLAVAIVVALIVLSFFLP
jgi:hypothetical protein